MYAVLEDRNQQYRVQSGDRILIALQRDLAPGEPLTFDRVCVLGAGDGAEAQVGTPYVDGASVSAKVVRQDVKGPKLIVQKMRRRKNHRKRTGFRARYTEIEIESIVRAG